MSRRVYPAVEGGWSKRIARPWCVRCISWAAHLGVVCDWHWGVLSEETRAALTAETLKSHPRGGRVRLVPEQMWIVAQTDARSEWAAQQAIEDAEDEAGQSA